MVTLFAYHILVALKAGFNQRRKHVHMLKYKNLCHAKKNIEKTFSLTRFFSHFIILALMLMLMSGPFLLNKYIFDIFLIVLGGDF